MTDPRTAYREASALGLSPVQSVVRLYEQIIEDIGQALKAIEQNQIELRTHKINHAILVIGYLQSHLNFQSGGKVAQNLSNYYETMRQNLVHAQTHASADMLARQITDLLEVKAAWLEVERAERSATASPPDGASSSRASNNPSTETWSR